MKKKKSRLIPILVLAVAVIAGAVTGIRQWQKAKWEATYITINGTDYLRDSTQLDLRGVAEPELDRIPELQDLRKLDLRDTGITPEQHDALQNAMPQCEIAWSVPFQGGWVDWDTQTLTVTALTAEDIGDMDYLERLTAVDGTACRDYEQLLALQQHRPDCAVAYTVNIQGQELPLDAVDVVLESLSAEELTLMRTHLTDLSTITLTQIQREPEALLDMMEANPDITFLWDTEICGVTVSSQAEFLDFSDIAIDDVEALESIVTRLPNLTQVDMCNCGISNEEMDALNRRHENIKFVWSIDFGVVVLRTDITYLMPYQYDLWFFPQTSDLLRYFTELICLDLGHHSITDCEFVAYMPKLRYLLLGDTCISDLTPLEGLQDLIYLEIFLTCVTDYTPLLQLKNLESLNLCYSRGQVEVIAQMDWVEYIRWITNEGHKLTRAQQQYLQESLPNTLLEFGVCQSSTGGMWRQHDHYYEQRDILGMHYMTG